MSEIIQAPLVMVRRRTMCSPGQPIQPNPVHAPRRTSTGRIAQNQG